MTTMKAAIFDKFGEPENVLHIEEVPRPEINDGQVLIKTTYSVIHNHNLLSVEGAYGIEPKLPLVEGSEGAGVIVELGKDVSNLKIGQRVAVARGVTGSWAQYFAADAYSVVAITDSIDDKTAAQITSMPMSASLLLDQLGLQTGEWFACNAANGLVGIFLAHLAKAKGVKMVKIVRRDEAKRLLEARGLDSVVVSNNGWTDEAKKITGGADIKAAVDSVGGDAGEELFRLLADDGKLVIFGTMTGKPLTLGGGGFIINNKTIEGFWVLAVIRNTPKTILARHQAEIIELVTSGAVPVPVGGIYDLEDIKKAVKASGEGKEGKILLRVD